MEPYTLQLQMLSRGLEVTQTTNGAFTSPSKSQ